MEGALNDIVYVLGSGSEVGNREIRESVRLVQKFEPDRKIWIVGEPIDIEGAISLPVPETARAKETRIMEKILRACGFDMISEDFIFFNDDYFLTGPIPDPLPYFYEGTVTRAHRLRRKNGAYKAALENTFTILEEKNRPEKYYDVHVPMIYNRRLFPEIMAGFDWRTKWGYTIKSLYGNSIAGKDVREITDLKLFDSYESVDQIRAVVGDRWVFSIEDSAINDTLWHYLQTL